MSIKKLFILSIVLNCAFLSAQTYEFNTFSGYKFDGIIEVTQDSLHIILNPKGTRLEEHWAKIEGTEDKYRKGDKVLRLKIYPGVIETTI